MRILLTGATGFIGSAVLARLKADGHEVLAVSRSAGPAARRLAPDRWIALDMARASQPADWTPHLQGVDAVINCAGVLQDGGRDSTAGVHVRGAEALFAACEAAGVRRVIHLSAIGADRGGVSSFSATKAEGDQALASRDLDWVILRPSVVVGGAAYGGSALFRGLAALPFLPRTPDAGPLQIVQLDEVVETVLFFLRPEAPGRLALELAGPERLGFDEVVAAYRRWLGYAPAKRAPGGFLLPLAYRLGDLAGAFGWRPPIRSNARREIVRGAVGDPTEWTARTGIQLRQFAAALAAQPASVQERWFANLYLMKALVFVVFAGFWLATAFISIGPGYERGERLMQLAGAGPLSGPSVVAGAFADLVIGLGLLWRRTARLALWGALGLSIFYLIAGTILLPELWAEPLGPMTKIFPIMVLNLVALAILEDR
ncbi:SDR family oxidoreductase [Phenylobacterium sp.]|uniref:SDR family oxidoreductase n=1 Tax=Phenylobacterium sp. TaxID=1871053 RepID=UPI002810EFFA|nr:SDR family oxidoreductase [Phenylobacterium sp.]